MRFRVIMMSPQWNVVRRFTVEADDEFTAVDVAMAHISEKRWDDPEASLDIQEVAG